MTKRLSATPPMDARREVRVDLYAAVVDAFRRRDPRCQPIIDALTRPLPPKVETTEDRAA